MTAEKCKKQTPCDVPECRYALPGGRCVFDVCNNGPLSLSECAKIFGISRNSVFQSEKRALGKFKKRLFKFYGKEDWNGDS